MACSSAGETKAVATTVTFSALHPDVIQTHILTRLDGPALASAAATSSQLHSLSSHEPLWANLCHSTWPSTDAPRIRHLISTFPHRSRSFFSDSFPPAATASTTAHSSKINPDRTPELISAVDLCHRRQLILSKVVETETESGWFRCSPFRVDLLDPKDAVQTPVRYPSGDEDACRDLRDELRLSWILIDPRRRRAVNLSSQKPVSVQRHWLSGEVQVRFATVIGGGERGSASEMALCSLVVTWSGEMQMQVREACMEMEDMEGMHLNGRDSLVILQRALEGKRGRVKNKGAGAEEEGRERYREFERRKKERKEGKVRAEGRLDMLCAGLAAATSFLGLSCLFVFWTWN